MVLRPVAARASLTAACTGFYSLLLVRFLFGAGEAGAYPNAARVISRWYPTSERGRVQGLIQTAALVGGAAAPVVAAYLIRGLGWRGAFVIFGGLGVIWAVAFWLWFRDDPARHPAVNAGELALLGGERGLVEVDPFRLFDLERRRCSGVHRLFERRLVVSGKHRLGVAGALLERRDGLIEGGFGVSFQEGRRFVFEGRRRRRPRMGRAALRPGVPITPPPGWAAAPQR